MEPYGWQFFGTFDLARIALWSFWLFFAGLVYYLQRENQREGYPLENDDGSPAGSLFSVPEPKAFALPHGGVVMAPGPRAERAALPLARTNAGQGFPFEPTGNAMADGVGPASYALRRDEPELDAHGHPKIRPMRAAAGFVVSAGRDPRGMRVVSNDRHTVGTVTDLWVDVPEQLVRYLEVDLGAAGKRLLPMPMARITGEGVKIGAIAAASFAGIPGTAAPDRVSKLEEDRISGYVAGGYLYDQEAKGSKMAALGELF